MTFEQAIQLVENQVATKTGKILTAPEIEILRAAWEKQPYTNLADSLYLSVARVKAIASQFWQLLSEVFEQKITKANLRNFLEQKTVKSSEVIGETTEEIEADFAEFQGNVLIVDDTVENLRLLSKLLMKQRYKVRTANNGQIALKTALNNPPDVILLDIKMPGMDGYQVCQALKEAEETAEVPIIFISALDEVIDKVKAFQLGAVDYITKPFQAEEVIARIKNQLTIEQQKKRLRGEIEQRRQTEETLYQSRAFLASVLNSSPNGIAALQGVREIVTGEIEDFRCLVANPVFVKILDCQRKELMGSLVIKKLLNQLDSQIFELLVEVVETGEALKQIININQGERNQDYQLIAVK